MPTYELPSDGHVAEVSVSQTYGDNVPDGIAADQAQEAKKIEQAAPGSAAAAAGQPVEKSFGIRVPDGVDSVEWSRMVEEAVAGGYWQQMQKFADAQPQLAVMFSIRYGGNLDVMRPFVAASVAAGRLTSWTRRLAVTRSVPTRG